MMRRCVREAHEKGRGTTFAARFNRDGGDEFSLPFAAPATPNVVAFFLRRAPQREDRLIVDPLRKAIHMSHDPVVTSALHAEADQSRNAFSGEAELGRRARRRHHVEDLLRDRRDERRRLKTPNDSAWRAHFFEQFVLFALRHVVQVTNETRGDLRFKAPDFAANDTPFSLPFSFFCQRGGYGEGKRRRVRMRPSLLIDRPIRVREPSIRRDKPPLGVRRADSHRIFSARRLSRATTTDRDLVTERRFTHATRVLRF